ncbi:hypothetical protein TRM7557_03891 [Tritonibacter multivorans]|uniref:Uncharacterized protein n=1 Tax=Tritonibacter multivorans TaxID=928856 RepID=A0A0N7M159_9RHOB|nr:hypothetical protein [Tritonibacter multivorans]MDA7421463.1 hypothetical protein [Tritonibacter multivorans]CUH82353.1 hypothetical protein TRM7557_03891 [Tritonibacter multivorans]SFC99090.1 hypothetical protein SAMN04488049_105237 [Tritonibacter multivorans]
MTTLKSAIAAAMTFSAAATSLFADDFSCPATFQGDAATCETLAPGLGICDVPSTWFPNDVAEGDLRSYRVIGGYEMHLATLAAGSAAEVAEILKAQGQARATEGEDSFLMHWDHDATTQDCGVVSVAYRTVLESGPRDVIATAYPTADGWVVAKYEGYDRVFPYARGKYWKDIHGLMSKVLFEGRYE